MYKPGTIIKTTKIGVWYLTIENEILTFPFNKLKNYKGEPPEELNLVGTSIMVELVDNEIICIYKMK